MEEYIPSIKTAMPEAQNRALETFINKSEKEGYPISASGEPTGEKLFSVPAKPTDPAQYNTAISSALADLDTLYSGLDAVTYTGNGLDNKNRNALDRIQTEVEKLEGAIKNISALQATSAAYTHVIQQDFVTDYGDQAFLPKDLPKLRIDPDTGCLTRPIALDISRLVSYDRNQMCKVEVESMLGTSAEGRHPLTQAVDGDSGTFWQETILSDVPIVANKASVPWLKHTSYTGGAAVRLRFDFEALTPISEVSIKPLADYPIQVLDISWSTSDTPGKKTGGAIDVGGQDWPDVKWTTAHVGSPTITKPLEGQDGTTCLKVVFDGSSATRAVLLQNVQALQPGSVYTLSFRAKSSSGTGFVTAEIGTNSGTTTLFRYSPKLTKQWNQYTFLITMPPAFSDIPVLKLTMHDRQTLWVDDLQINTNCLSMAPTELRGANKAIVVPLAQNLGQPIMARSLWLTLCQPNYNLRTYTFPKKWVDLQEVWSAALEGSNASSWQTTASPWRDKEDLLPPGVTRTSPLAAAAQRLGGKIKSILARLFRLATDSSEEMISIAKYEYTIGAWEIDLRYKDYGPEGYWVSKPLGVKGEIRQMTVVPSIGPLEADKVKVYLLPRADSPIDANNAYLLDKSWNVYFSPTTESGVISRGVNEDEDVVIPIQPKHIKLSNIQGTDRYRKVALPAHPYFNAEKAWQLHQRVTAGSANKQNRYDPNATALAYVDQSTAVPTVKTIAGYNPVKVTLNIAGQVVPPDIIGRTPYTKYKVYRDENLQIVPDATTLTHHRTSTTAGTASSEQTTRNIRVYRTSKPICRLAGQGSKVAIYRHKKNQPQSTDVLIDPSKYSVRWEKQVGSLANPGNPLEGRSVTYADTIEIAVESAYDNDEYTFVAYYRTEVPASVMVNDAIDDGDLDYKYINSEGAVQTEGITELALQSYPVTRNVTDYLTGKVPSLRPANMDRTDPGYYPVYEYYVDESGNLIFANDLFKFGDTPAIIEVEYDTLNINPRIVIAFDKPEVGTSTCSTPIITDYTILLNARN